MSMGKGFACRQPRVVGEEAEIRRGPRNIGVPAVCQRLSHVGGVGEAKFVAVLDDQVR